MLYDALLIPQLCEEPNDTQITPLEPNGIILSSVLCSILFIIKCIMLCIMLCIIQCIILIIALLNCFCPVEFETRKSKSKEDQQLCERL